MSAFVLASASPRRRALLAAAGLDPEIRPQDVDETPRAGEAPIAYAMRVALAKLDACKDPRPVLAADTVVALDGAILGKAGSRGHAAQMLRALSGRSHTVHTAVAVHHRATHANLVSTEVNFRRLTDADIERYLALGESMDKAGAYGIQGGGGALVASIAGSYTNVVGLPLEETLQLLRLAGIVA